MQFAQSTFLHYSLQDKSYCRMLPYEAEPKGRAQNKVRNAALVSSPLRCKAGSRNGGGDWGHLLIDSLCALAGFDRVLEVLQSSCQVCKSPTSEPARFLMEMSWWTAPLLTR